MNFRSTVLKPVTNKKFQVAKVLPGVCFYAIADPRTRGSLLGVFHEDTCLSHRFHVS